MIYDTEFHRQNSKAPYIELAHRQVRKDSQAASRMWYLPRTRVKILYFPFPEHLVHHPHTKI